mmetsp:Transcript_132341/g.342365  ORF Transcript_132341/g.342365 Transcript_132341/m.342365 type:complete len:105 (+) Transcript_132341:1512-1826(+)
MLLAKALSANPRCDRCCNALTAQVLDVEPSAWQASSSLSALLAAATPLRGPVSAPTTPGISKPKGKQANKAAIDERAIMKGIPNQPMMQAKGARRGCRVPQPDT